MNKQFKEIMIEVFSEYFIEYLEINPITRFDLFQAVQEAQPPQLRGIFDMTQEIFDTIVTNLLDSGVIQENDGVLSLVEDEPILTIIIF